MTPTRWDGRATFSTTVPSGGRHRRERERLLCHLRSAKIRDPIAATDMTTVIGAVKFRPDGTGIVQAAFAPWQNGKQELVWPKEFATAPLAYPAPPFAKR